MEKPPLAAHQDKKQWGPLLNRAVDGIGSKLPAVASAADLVLSPNRQVNGAMI